MTKYFYNSYSNLGVGVDNQVYEYYQERKFFYIAQKNSVFTSVREFMKIIARTSCTNTPAQWFSPLCNLGLQSAKILLLPPKYEIIIVPSNHSNFQFCDSNIGLFSIAPCKVITLDPHCILFGISSLLHFWRLSFRKSYCSSNYRYSNICCPSSLLKAIAKRLPLLFAIVFQSVMLSQYLKNYHF